MRRRARTRIVGATAFVVSIAVSLGGCSNIDASRSTLPPATTTPATTSSSTSTTSTSSTTTTTIDDRIPTADEQALVQARLGELLNRLSLYKALGGEERGAPLSAEAPASAAERVAPVMAIARSLPLLACGNMATALENIKGT